MEATTTRVASVFLMFALVLINSVFCFSPAGAPAVSATSLFNVTAVFAFGDSTLDSGNNNGIDTLLRADHPPYGRDFPDGVATGRFTNGKLLTDFLVSGLGIKDSLPAYRDPNITDVDLSTGVSFASAGSGLDDLTATEVNVIKMGSQLEDFKACRGRLRSAVGEEEANRTVGNAIFVVGAGSNDMMMNYYLLPLRKASYSLTSYHGFLLGNLRSVVEELYNMGGRKFAIAGIPPIGCLPFTMTAGMLTSSPVPLQRRCVDEQNEGAASYNRRLQQLVSTMQGNLHGTTITYVDTYSPLMDMMKNSSKYGFTMTGAGCCGTGIVEMGPLCGGLAITCEDPSKYLFWDAVHPTQAAYEAMAGQLMQTVLPLLL